MFKIIYYAVSLAACFPVMIWNALVSVIMWDAKYFDECMQSIADLLNIID